MILLAFHLRLQPNAVQHSSLASPFSTFFFIKAQKKFALGKAHSLLKDGRVE